MPAWCLGLLLALQADAPVKPAKPLDSKDPQSVVDHAVYNTRSQKSYETSFTARLMGKLDYKGRSVWVGPDVLYMHFTGSGNNDQKIVRAGAKSVWIHHEFNGWLTAEVFGDAGAGRGIQNPDEVLAVLAKHTARAKFLKSGALEVTLSGDDLAKIMKGQGINGAIDPKASSARVELIVDGETRVQKFSCDATVVTTAEKVRYSSEVTVAAYNGETELAFANANRKPIPLSKEIRDRIDAVLNPKK